MFANDTAASARGEAVTAGRTADLRTNYGTLGRGGSSTRFAAKVEAKVKLGLPGRGILRQVLAAPGDA